MTGSAPLPSLPPPPLGSQLCSPPAPHHRLGSSCKPPQSSLGVWIRASCPLRPPASPPLPSLPASCSRGCLTAGGHCQHDPTLCPQAGVVALLLEGGGRGGQGGGSCHDIKQGGMGQPRCSGGQDMLPTTKLPQQWCKRACAANRHPPSRWRTHN